MFFYSGGVLGSFLPGIVYERYGWNALVAVLLGVATAGWGMSASLLTHPVPPRKQSISTDLGTEGAR